MGRLLISFQLEAQLVGSFGKARQLEWSGEETEKKTKTSGGKSLEDELERSDLNGAWGSTLRWG